MSLVSIVLLIDRDPLNNNNNNNINNNNNNNNKGLY